MEVILAQPRGFCAGVERAIHIVEKALEKYKSPVYVRHEIVHNQYVVNDLKKKGAIFVDELFQIPEGSITIFSAHGVSDAVEEDAKIRNLEVIDATCPLVTKVQLQAKRQESLDKKIIMIGHKGHPEVEGTTGKVKQEVMIVSSVEDVRNLPFDINDNLAYVTQTTLSVDDTTNIIHELKSRFSRIEGPDLKNICYATQNRQDAVRKLSRQAEIILVVGSQKSSNSNRLKDLGEENGIKSYLIDNASNIDYSWFESVKVVGITAGASAPEVLVQEVLSCLKEKFDVNISLLQGIEENIKFKLPKELC
ncbi:MAG: 4-hydroxy-3-methylbut-2-enyl diphosphate reductase [Rickettsiales bacterium]|nr:4-hydroxy-3-methylbut-2-enyl diphosphate reductase [Rickettsiales bacterium]